MTQRETEQQLEQLGAFEISDEMLTLARHNAKSNVFLNAGRGNPNWINKQARLAFNRLVEFGISESNRTINDGNLGGYTIKDGIYDHLISFLQPTNNATDAFISQALQYTNTHLKLNLDDVVHELTDGVLGNNYPVPSRVLYNTERIISSYLTKTLFHGVDLSTPTQIFPTEGGTAAIVYLFNSLRENHLLEPGDKIAINTPIFTPYLQIPTLNDYELQEIDLRSTEENNWEIKVSEIEKLKDKTIKALFLVNPSNPGAMAFDHAALVAIQKMVTANPNLIIITDDVYGTFVDDFQSVYAIAPHNTLLVYSYSKLFGATGWRLGLIAAHRDNVFDRLIQQLPSKTQALLNHRYAINVVNPSQMPFIERLVADSRSVGLYHTAGLSTPQQIMEVLFSLTYLIHDGQTDPYIETAKQIVHRRYHLLYQNLGLPENISRQNSKYYALIDIYQLAELRYDAAFRDYLAENFEQVDFLYNLSQKNGVVLMDGVGFGAEAGILRISQANLPDEDYGLIAQQILELLAEYHTHFKCR
ncbi:bifunctional aspartate transaminase/aspartate 4-decarboxylase [Periweissella fabaria]|uniref:Aminotransferase n=1 Tax=Periweissella fabaria TaxID=546157 RepID=A0ABM8Z4E9_9LACO|nr:bifunctional aspartate transaminase/aspartate 4-decarboxylase [Periweissella fabaria]MCM0597456.1 bifunctional aspartate transaminase/aspartate 4-decarboxylase [Periweissella fabaria]CAH0416039.1 Bifunctional aspartate aminotransferase and L-aspartate beta-decarboxylase [Periweissella fabaria]